MYCEPFFLSQFDRPYLTASDCKPGEVYMKRFTFELRLVCVQMYYKNGRSFGVALKNRTKLGRYQGPTELTVRNLIKKLDEIGSISVIF